MTLKEMIKITGELPNNGITENGVRFAVDVTKQKLNYVACLWEIKGYDVKERVIKYGTGHTPEKAKETLKNKILKE